MTTAKTGLAAILIASVALSLSLVAGAVEPDNTSSGSTVHTNKHQLLKRDFRENRMDRRENRRDRREDIRDRREDRWDAHHNGGKRDKVEDIVDRREDRRDRREDRRDKMENRWDRHHGSDKGYEQGTGKMHPIHPIHPEHPENANEHSVK